MRGGWQDRASAASGWCSKSWPIRCSSSKAVMTAFIAVSVVMIAEAAAPATILSNQQGHRLGAVIQATGRISGHPAGDSR